MPPDKYGQWLAFARQDFKAAQVLFEEGIFNQTCFHAQQAVEKYLKAFLIRQKAPLPKVHSLIELLGVCQTYDSSLARHEQGCRHLDQFYLPSRYPDAIVGSLPEGLPTKTHAEEALRLASQIIDELDPEKIR